MFSASAVTQTNRQNKGACLLQNANPLKQSTGKLENTAFCPAQEEDADKKTRLFTPYTHFNGLVHRSHRKTREGVKRCKAGCKELGDKKTVWSFNE